MDEIDDPSTAGNGPPRSSVLPMMTVILVVSIVIFILMLINFLNNRPTPPPLIPTAVTQTLTPSITPSPTITSTITRTPRPSWTPLPTATVTRTITPSPTRTSTLYPTITPATPVKDNIRYRLKDWTVTDADSLIRQVEAKRRYAGLPDVWYPATAYTQAEAILRFPDTLQTATWQWGLAASLAYSNDPGAAQQYADLIRSAIDSGQVRIEDLPAWFQLNQPTLMLTMYPLQIQPGELNRQLLEISGAGAAYLWLLQTPTSIQVYPLMSDFDLVDHLETSFVIADLTDDGIDEISIYRTLTPGRTHYPPLRVFSQAQIPPLELPIAAEMPLDFYTEWTAELVAVPSGTGPQDLQLTVTLFPACPVYYTRSYHWSGSRFEVVPQQYSLSPQPGLEAACENAVDHAAMNWGAEPAMQLALQTLPVWPPLEDLQGKPYSADARDAWRFRLGIYQALNNHQLEAVQTMTDLVEHPTAQFSSWITLAGQFLERYQTPQDIYQACVGTPFCNLRTALESLVAYSGMTDPTQVFGLLQQNGVSIRTNGYFDFDEDGVPERWFTVQPAPQEKLEFWIVAKVPNGLQAVFVMLIEDNTPQPYFYEPKGVIPVVQFEANSGFSMRRMPESQVVYLEFVSTEASRPTYLRDAIHTAAQSLLYGAPPQDVLDQLLGIQADPRFRADCLAFYICGKFWYTLGLTYELLDQGPSAVSAYLFVWRDFPTSPYTVMARMKLVYVPPPRTDTPTPTLTGTVTHTPDPNATRTPTPTVTSTPDPNATPTNTADPNASPTPTLTPTTTPTPTDTQEPSETPTDTEGS